MTKLLWMKVSAKWHVQYESNVWTQLLIQGFLFIWGTIFYIVE